MSDSSPRIWQFYLDDMISCAEKVISYSAGFDQIGFVSSGLNYDATIRNLELIGEAATHIPEAIRSKRTEIPWRMIIATRNRLIHGYLGIDNDTLWSIISRRRASITAATKSVRGRRNRKQRNYNNTKPQVIATIASDKNTAAEPKSLARPDNS